MRTQCTYYSSPKCLAFLLCLKTKAISFLPCLSLSLSLSLSLWHTHTHTLSLSFLFQVFFHLLYSIFFHSHVCHQSSSTPLSQHPYTIAWVDFRLKLSCINAVLHYEYPILQQKFTIALLLKCKKKKKRKKCLPQCSFTHMHLGAYLWIYHAIMVMAQSSSYQILCLFLDVCPVELKGI